MCQGLKHITISEEPAASFIRVKPDGEGSLAGSSTMLLVFLFYHCTSLWQTALQAAYKGIMLCISVSQTMIYGSLTRGPQVVSEEKALEKLY
jgi:hypothetical protein